MADSLQAKKLSILISLLQNHMGMERQAAASIVSDWHRSNSPAGFASTFMVQAIQHQIDLFRKQSFAKFGITVAVFPSDGTRSLKVRLPHFGWIQVGHRRYTFATHHNEQPAKSLSVRLFNGTIEVLFCNTWQPVSAYLNEVNTEPTYALSPERAWDAQFRWWKTNGKKFNFMDLPGELRNKIYDNIIGPVVRPFPADRSRKRSLVYTPDLAITRLNRTVRKEANHRLFSTVVFVLENNRLTQRLLHNTICTSVRHLTLALSHSEYFSLFGLNPDRIDLSIRHSRVLSHLRDMDLTTLQIHFAPPSKIAEKFWLEGACQKSVIEHTLEAAWASIKGHPLELTGSVNRRQKDKFESRSRKARKEFEAWKALKLAATGEPGSLREYDEYLKKLIAEPVGGVMLEGGACVEEAAEAQRDVMSFGDFTDSLKCGCKRNCMKEWGVNA